MSPNNESQRVLHRAGSEGEMTAQSSVDSVRDAAEKTRESIRQSRATIQALRAESRQALRESRELRKTMKAVLGQRISSSYSPAVLGETYDNILETESLSDVSDVTFDTITDLD